MGDDRGATSPRYLLISSDCHAGPPEGHYREYLDPEYRDAYDRFNELLTGDQFNFLPIQESVLFNFFGADQAQHQFLSVNAVSEALHFASPATKRVRWIAGAYLIATDRFISTGNVFDLGTGE